MLRSMGSRTFTEWAAFYRAEVILDKMARDEARIKAGLPPEPG